VSQKALAELLTTCRFKNALSSKALATLAAAVRDILAVLG